MQYRRRKSSVVHVGSTPLGGDYPIRVQSMANVSTMDKEAAVAQAMTMRDAGAEYIRFTAQGEREARHLGEIREAMHAEGNTTPLVADIHFNPRAADIAAEKVEKVRINPGNYVDKKSRADYTEALYLAELQKIRDRLTPFLQLCKAHHTAIRIGVNHGSLSDRIMSRYGDTPEGMVASCMEFLRICREEQFEDIVLSIKASNTVVMVKTVRLLVQTMEQEGMSYPLHLGVTEAGDQEDGRIKSAVGIGALLADGIGDTIRVSLSEPPEDEMPVARKLIDHITARAGHAPIEEPVTFNGWQTDYSREVYSCHGIGGEEPPIVISDRSHEDGEIDLLSKPDFLYVGRRTEASAAAGIPLLIDADCWQGAEESYPYFTLSQHSLLATCEATLKFVELSYASMDPELLSQIRRDPAVVLLLKSSHLNSVGEMRAALLRIKEAGVQAPVVLQKGYDETDLESFQVKVGADLGVLFLDRMSQGVMVINHAWEGTTTDRIMFGLLQATRVRISKTEFISCPGCGRTLYDLHTTIARVKDATSHLKGLKIGIMGCIVNGPGEMADADYGYVGVGRKKISLYKGKSCVMRDVPEEEAVEQLVQLIKVNGDWK